MTVELFIPCFIDQLYPDTAFNTVKVLEKAGCIVNYNPEQTCCGQPAFNAGFWDDAKAIGSKFLNDFQGGYGYCFTICLMYRYGAQLL
jgi:L-lactate dehydrogenase complex protein LldE